MIRSEQLHCWRTRKPMGHMVMVTEAKMGKPGWQLEPQRHCNEIMFEWSQWCKFIVHISVDEKYWTSNHIKQIFLNIRHITKWQARNFTAIYYRYIWRGLIHTAHISFSVYLRLLINNENKYKIQSPSLWTNVQWIMQGVILTIL